MNALVTGGGGFLGRYIVEQLVARGDKVRVFCRNRHESLETLGVEFCFGDLNNIVDVPKACEGIDTVFHVAALPGIRCQWEPFFETNTLGTLHVLNGCFKHGVKKLVYTSSPSVTFHGKDQCGVDESAPYTTCSFSHYSQTKAMAEQIVLKSNGRNGLLTCALRPHLIWGPRDQHLIPRLLDRARKGKLKRVGNGTNLVDVTYVENAATAHLQAADALVAGSRVAGNSYFISQGKPVNCWNWIDELLELAGLPKVSRSVSYRTAWCAGALLELWYKTFRITSEPAMTRFLAAQLSHSHWFDISKAKNDFGYVPLISTEEGLTRLAKELRTQT